MSQTVQSTMKLSKEVSEESYSKTSISSSSTKMMSSSLESSESVSSLQRLTSEGGDSADSLMKEVMGDKTSVVSKMSDNVSGSSVVSSSEKSSMVVQSEGEFSYKMESEMKSSYEKQETSKSVSSSSSKEVSVMKSVEASSEKVIEAISSGGEEEETPSVKSEKEPVYVVIMDYTPREGDKEGLPVSEGQEVVVVDASRAHKWRVKLRQTTAGAYMMTEGTVPSCYLEKKEIQSPPTTPTLDPKMQVWMQRREKVLKELVESEEAFSRDMQFVVNNYIKEMESKHMPKDLRDYKDTLFANFKAISEFHNNVLMKGIQYYGSEPARLGKTFLRLERDFDMHVAYCRDEPEAQQLLTSGSLKDYFDEFSRKLQDDKTLSEHLKLPIQRINDYQLLLKELIKYTARLKEDTTDLEKAHDFMQAIPQRIEDLQYLNSIQGYRGNLHKLGRILKRDWFEVTDGNNYRKERFVFLFKGRMFVTDAKRVGVDRQIFLVKYIIKLADVEIVDNADDDELKLRFQHLRKGQAGFPLTLKAKTMEQKEDWLKEIQVTAIPQGLEDLGEDEPEPIIEEPEAKKTKLEEEKSETKVEVLEDFEAYEEMQTVITESVRSGSLTSLDDFHSALDDESSMCFTASEFEAGGGAGRPRFVKPLRASSCVEGSVATLECEVAASPSPVVAWLKDNQPLKPSTRASLETDGAKQRLVLKNTEADDAGLYTIIASNTHGTVSCSAPLAVHSGPETLPPSTPGGSPMPYGPVFLEKLRDMELQEGTAFRVSTVVQGEPTPTVSFYKDDQDIKKEGRVHYTQENKECYELVIENVLPEDSGKYSCVATSSAGQNITFCNLTVTSQKVFIQPPDDRAVEVSTPELTEPDPQWVKDKEFEASERFKVSIDEAEDTVALVFQHVTPDDAGMYTCVASTSGGKISCSAELTVQGGVPREPEAPKTSSSTTKVEAKEGESALLELTATGFPKPKITWSKDGKELKPGDKYMILQEDEETYTMAIKNVAKDDSGAYKASATNELGQSDLSYELDVTCAPKFTKQMKDTSVMKDETIKFEVEIDGRPEPTITWCKDGQQLSETDRIKFEAEGNTRRLVIKKATSQDAGNYSCTIKNKFGSQAGFGALQVKTPAKFVEKLKDTSVSQGQDAALKVKVSGHPKPDLKWKKDGSDIKVDGTTIIQREESSEEYTLIIKKTTIKDSGSYSCEVKNEFGKDESTGKLIVKGKPNFSQELKDRTVKEGEKDVDLTVKIEGDTKPKIRWYIGDMEITESKNYKIQENEAEGTFTLKIKEVTPEVAGVYKCEASNEVGKNATSATVTVVEEVKTAPPKFVQPLKDCSVKEGEDASFTIKVDGQPKPTPKWNKDGAELKIDNKRVKVTSEGEDSFTLVIKESTKKDAGNYTCTITNTSGSESSSSKLTVTETETKPSFQQGLKDVTVKEEETIKLTVKISGTPKPTEKWNKDGAELTVDNKKVQVTSEAEDSLTLIINKATKEDGGEYSCTITNKSGSETTSNKVVVKESEKKPTFEQGLKDQSVKEEETLKLKVKFSGRPKPEAKWNKDGADLTIPRDRTKVISEEEDSLTLVIERVTKEDGGKYTCTIKNSSGSETTSSKVTVTESGTKPTFEQGLKDQSVKEEETVKLKVKFSGKPKPEAKWNKDGAELTLPGDRTKVISEEDDSLTLVIGPAKKDDTGKYTCVITNTSGSETTTSKVTVTESEKPPSFTQGLKNVSCKEEETVKFTVKFKGQPKPTAKWNKDGAELTIDNKRVKQITEAEDSLTIVIDNVTLKDAGKYSCTITNSSGKESTDCELTVTESLKAPSFRQGLKDITVKEEQTAKFTVKFDGKPKPTAKWTKDGAELTIDGKKIKTVTEAEDSLTLIINQSAKDDAGKYSCTITNSSGSESTSSKLTVSDTMSSPTFKEGLKDQDIKEGDTATMTVVFGGKPKPSAKWTLDGSDLTIDGKHVVTKTEADDSVTLIINQATKEDVGKYACVLTNSCGTASSSGRLKIKAAPIFVKGLEDTEGEEGGSVRLNVKYSGEPEPIATWKKDGAPLDIDGKHVKVALDADDSQSLVLDSVKKEDVGVYSCEIKNPHGSSSTSGKLSVTGKPVIKKKLEDKEVKEGESVELITEVRATPPADVKWFFNDREITANENYEMVEDKSKGVYKLVVKKAKSDLQGKYKCEASNPSGKTETTGTVSVLVKPTFLKALSDTVVTEEESVKLETSIAGNPKPDVTWFKEKKQLSPSDRYVISSKDDSHSLTIKDSVIEDSSTYTCKAKNKAGEVSQKATVTVKSKRETQGPKFLTHIGDQVIVVGDAARFEVKVTGKPAPQVTWYKDDEQLADKENVVIKTDAAENTHTLTLKNLEISDSATYKCKAVNESGEAQESAKLTVQEPVAPKIEGLEDVEVRFAAPARIKAKISGFPKPEVKWSKNDVEVKPTDEAYEITKDTEHDKYSLSVKSVKGNEAGEYTCFASNSAGSAEAKCVISVKPQAPVFMKEMKDLSIELGENFKFHVEVHGYPTPTITWLKDNNAIKDDGHFTTSQIEKDYIYTLQVTDPNLKDAGLYTCKAANSAGEERSKGTVKIKDFAPILQQKLPESVQLTEGDKLHLKAKFTGQPTPEVKWMKDGKPLKLTDKMKATLHPDGTAELVVDDVTHDDSGPYRVIAVNDKGQSSCETDVAVAFAEKKTVPFVRQLQDVDMTKGSPLNLEAKVSGNPKPIITWFKNGEALDAGKVAPHVKISVQPDGTAVLNIERAELEDAGEYKLTASNELGEDNSTAVVQVSLPGKKPFIIRELKPIRFQEGATGFLETKVSGYPEPKVSWLLNGRNILESAHCNLTYDPDGESTLTINGITKDDGGMYTVVASNKMGKAFSEAPLSVIPVVKTEEKAPKKIFEFLQGLMPALVPEGRPLKLEAQVTIDPVPVYYKWCKDGKDLAPNEKVEMTQTPDGFLRLCIKQMTPDDRGRYAVVASDGMAEIKSEAVVTMVPALPGMAGNKPYFTKGLQPLKLSEGERLTLQATLPPDMKVSVKWMKDGEEISRGGRVQMLEQPDGSVALVIDGATPADSGKYVVVASNEDGKTRSSANVAVIGHGFKLPEIVEVLKPASFLEGEPAKLEAKVSGEPKPEVKWLRDGEEVKPNDRIKMSELPDGRVTLEIKEVKPDEAGKYTMIISNIGGETRCSAPVNINQSPLFVSPLKAVTGVEGFPNKLEAKITGEPVPQIKWLKNGVEVPNHVKQVRHPDGTAALVFDKCIPDDAGSYSCKAKNPFGEKESDADFKVIGRDVEGKPKCAPSFVTPLSDISIPEGEPFKLEAEVAGNPLPNVQWFLNGQPLGVSDNIVPAFDGKKVSLSVNKSNPMHSGEYECKLSTDLGEAKSSGKVTVLGNKAPRFIERLSDMEFTGSGEMKLMCRVEGIPSPEVKWYYKGCRVEPGLKYTLNREGNKCLLVIPRPRTKDSGLYECKATNPIGSDSCSASIKVNPSRPEGEAAMFLKKLRDIGVLPGMTAKFIACMAGAPKPDIKWFKDGNELTRDSRYTFESDPNGVVRLLIRSATKSDVGTYRLSISNMYGSDTCTGDLILEGAGADIEKENIPPVQEVARPAKGGAPTPLAHAPYILKMSDVCVSLAWRPSIPQYAQVPFTYRLELCRDPDGEWTTYKSGIKDSCCDVRDLVPMVDYKFRIRVENKYGISEPSPHVTAHRSKLIPPAYDDRRPKDYELEHPPLEKYAAAPRFLRQEEEAIYAIRGQPARVEFWVYGVPQPKITWYFNNVEVETAKYDFLEDRNGQLILFITRMTDNDVGFYTCKAVNEHGEAQQKIKLMIAETPVFTKKLDEHTFMLRGGGEMECHVTGLPYPKIRWFKDWHPISESSRIKISWTEPGTCVLSLSNSILKDCGLYTCTATNVAGTASTSAMLNIEECETEYHLLTYKRPNFVKPNDRPLEDTYDIGDELGRGTQGISYHAVERKTGKSYAAKVMHGEGKLMDHMIAEMDVMNQLGHKRLVRLWDAYQTRSSVTLLTDICGGGELLPNLLQRGVLTESIVAYYIRQVLEGVKHMHERNIAHLGLTIGDLLVTRLNSDSIKIGDFGLATRLYSGRQYVQEYGHPEYVAPEVANKQPVSLASDMWSVGIISYLLLTGDSPFLRENDRETLKAVQKGNADFFNDRFVVLSDEARDFVSNLLSIDPSKRMDVTAALKHKWLEIAALPDKCDELHNMDQLKEYHKKWKSWYGNASCRRYYRRRTLESCFTHPSRMIYPPEEQYTPQATPERELGRTQVKPSAFDDVTFQQRIEREPIDVRSESHYQNGPDTFLLPLRDPDFPVRVRRYLKVGANRSPILARHLADKHWGYGDVAVKERRKFVDVMDEEIDDEKRGLSHSAALRLRHEVGTVGSGYDKIEMKSLKKKRGYRMAPGTAPYFREKIQDVVVREGQDAEFSCCVAANPDAQFSWFRNDGILIESSRIEVKKWSDGQCHLFLKPAKAYDVGVYKCVARNPHGIVVCRARLSMGGVPGKPEPPLTVKCSDTQVYLSWVPPKFEGHCPTVGYSLEYKETGEENWNKVANNISHEFYLVHDLKPSTTYHFRISALNKFGWSEFSEPSEPTLTLGEAAPKIELSRAEQFQQSQTESGQSLIAEEPERQKLDYGKEEDPVVMEDCEPTELYNFISEVSRGKFSMVMKVWSKKENTALMAKALVVNDTTSKSVEREFDIYKSLQHERIPVLHSASRSPTSVFLIMEKLSGIDVLTYLSSKSVYTEEMVSRIVHQVIDALEYLHFRSICYFELQPDNVVMVDKHHCQIKLVDFGSAQYVPDEGAKVKVQACLEYLAPEVVKGEEVHSAVDIWGVGVLTYILLSGVSPFAGESDLETKDNILYVRYHFDHLYKEVSQEATHFLMQLFKRTPQKRPTAEECLENKWLLPNEFMIKKREHTAFLPHHLREFSEKFHSLKAKSTPPVLLNIFGKSSSASALP